MTKELWRGFMVLGRYGTEVFDAGEHALESDLDYWCWSRRVLEHAGGPCPQIKQLLADGQLWVRIVSETELSATDLDEHPAVIAYAKIVQGP